VLRRGYGNHATLARTWQAALVEKAFTPCLQFQYAAGKNTSDIALALDALEAMFDGRAEKFCIVTSDSVCTGAFLLASLGMLEGLPVITHWEDIDDLRAQFPQLEVKEKLPFVDTGRVVTSAGISAGIGMSLHLVQRVPGAELAAATAHQTEYDWRPSVNSSAL
jgi:transcriptional regulator GlxA family with amidase domain